MCRVPAFQIHIAAADESTHNLILEIRFQHHRVPTREVQRRPLTCLLFQTIRKRGKKEGWGRRWPCAQFIVERKVSKISKVLFIWYMDEKMKIFPISNVSSRSGTYFISLIDRSCFRCNGPTMVALALLCVLLIMPASCTIFFSFAFMCWLCWAVS